MRSAHLLFIGGEDHHLRIPFMAKLQERGHRITVAACGDPQPLLRTGFDFRAFEFNRFFDPASDRRTRRALAQLLREIDADVAHAFDTKLALLLPFAARANPRTAIVRTINGRGWTFSSRSPTALALRAAYLPLQRIASFFTDATVFEHSGDQAFFTRNRLIGRSEPVLIPGAGIDIEGFERARRSGPAAEEMRDKLGLRNAEVVTTVTRVTKQKGVPALLRAADIIHQVRPGVRFLIVGPRESEGPFGVGDSEFRKRTAYVTATGSRADVPSILGLTDVFAFPSEYAEGVPRALMEAALCARPIVATDLAGCREVVRDGWNGLLTPLRDPGKLAEKILELLTSPSKASELGARGPEVIRSRFSLENVVSRHAELYQRLFYNRRSTRSSGGRGVRGGNPPDPSWARDPRGDGLGASQPGQRDPIEAPAHGGGCAL